METLESFSRQYVMAVYSNILGECAHEHRRWVGAVHGWFIGQATGRKSSWVEAHGGRLRGIHIGSGFEWNDGWCARSMPFGDDTYGSSRAHSLVMGTWSMQCER